MTSTLPGGFSTGLFLGLCQLPVTALALWLYEYTARRRASTRSPTGSADKPSWTRVRLPERPGELPMTDFSSSAQGMSLVAFTAVATITLLLCVMTGPDRDNLDEFYTGFGSLTPMRNGLAIAGDYISAATVLTTAGSSR